MHVSPGPRLDNQSINTEWCLWKIFVGSVFSWTLQSNSPMFASSSAAFTTDSIGCRSTLPKVTLWLVPWNHLKGFRVNHVCHFCPFGSPLSVSVGATKKILSHHQDIFKPTEARSQLQEIKTCTKWVTFYSLDTDAFSGSVGHTLWGFCLDSAPVWTSRCCNICSGK